MPVYMGFWLRLILPKVFLSLKAENPYKQVFYCTKNPDLGLYSSPCGGLSEWFIEIVSKTVVRSRVPGVRISYPPQAYWFNFDRDLFLLSM